MSTSTLPMREVLIGLRRLPQPNVFADVDHVDACGAPVLAGDARDMGICENDLPADTLVTVYGYRSGGKAEGFLTEVHLRSALHGVDSGYLRRIGARAFEVTTLKPATGPGLTHRQHVIRRNMLANR